MPSLIFGTTTQDHYARKVDLGSSRPGKREIFFILEFRLELELELGLKLE